MENPTQEIAKTTWEVVKDISLGFSSSWGFAAIWPEVVHGASVLLFGALSTVLIFFINRWLHKKYPKV